MSINIQTLRTLRDALRSTLEICIKQGDDNENINKIIATLRQVELTIVLNNESMYAIAGTQGAGKTTLAKETLGISERWLKPNPGRGEQIPLFIEQSRELKSGEQAAFYVCVNYKTGEIDRNVACKDDAEFVALLQDWNGLTSKEPQEGWRILYPKLRISTQDSFIDDELSWVLLPGYEITNQRNHRWQNMMRHVLLNARGVIVVTDQTILANSNQNMVQKDLQGNFAGRSPVVAISRTEALTEDQCEEVRATAAKLFNPERADSSNIVTIGIGNRERWIDPLREAIRNNLLNSAASEAAALERIMDIFHNDVGDIIDILKVLHSKMDDGEQSVEETLEAFDNCVDKYEKTLRRHLEKQLSAHKEAVFRYCELDYQQKEEGLRNNLKTLGRRFMFEGMQIERERKERVLDAWKRSYNNLSLSDRNFLVFDTVNRETLVAQGLLPENDNHTSLMTATSRIADKMGYTHSEQSVIEKHPASLRTNDDRQQVEETLRALLYKPQKGEEAGTPPALGQTMKVLPALVMEFARAGSAMDISVPGQTALAEEVLPKQIFDALFVKGENYYPIRTALGALIGLDAADGSLNGEYNPNAPGGAAAIALLGKAAVVASVAYGAYQLTGIIRDSDRAQIYFIKRMLDELAFSHIESVIGQYRDIMAGMRNVIEFNLNRRFGAVDVLSQKSEIILAIKKLSAVQKDARRYEAHFQQILA